MIADANRLDALLAVIDGGSFEAAAVALTVTPSAISQRIRALENDAGQVLVVRGAPCRATAAGEVLVRLARQQKVLVAEAEAQLRRPGAGVAARTTLPVAVNADSMSTWFAAVLPVVALWSDVLLDVRREDQDHSARLLRSGEVLAAVTSDPTPVQGCSSRPLTAMRYLAVARPELVEEHRVNGGPGWATMPMIRFNERDDLQHRILARHGVDDAPTHHIPSNEIFLRGIHAGMGWGVVTPSQLRDDLETGVLVALGPDDYVDVPLYWQRWRLRSPLLDRLSDAVVAAAAGLA